MKPFRQRSNRTVQLLDAFSRFWLVLGTTDVLLGSISGEGSLAILGLGIPAAAIAWRWWALRQSDRKKQSFQPRFSLPPAPPPKPLPNLTHHAHPHYRRRR